MKSNRIKLGFLAIALSCVTLSSFASGSSYEDSDSTKIWNKMILENPENLSVHQKYIRAVGLNNSDIVAQYEVWSVQFPNSSTIPFAIGAALANQYDFRAKDWLLKAVAIDPNLANAWQQLSFDAERWGDQKLANSYMEKAAKAEPNNPNYAFYYASALKSVAPDSYEQEMLQFVDKFPATERAAQALYWLANRETDSRKKAVYYERSLNEFPPKKFNWSASSMGEYFSFLLKEDPNAALALSRKMVQDLEEPGSWTRNVEIAEQVTQSLIWMEQGKKAEALNLIMTPKKGRLYGIEETLVHLTTDIMLANGQHKQAFDSLLNFYSKAPTYLSREKLNMYGSGLGLNQVDVQNAISQKLQSLAVEATAFELEKYTDGLQLRLKDLKGKVVLVTYWYPGCGPCRGEFPHFENVLKGFDRKGVEYVGINISPKEDPYVLPFMEASGHTFTPVKDRPELRGNLVANGAPTNYLIDKNGQIIFKNFMIGSGNEETLELMINHLLEF